ncbi:WD40 repeat protein [Streptomyces achromogenes]|uniref:caspase family protein n=1 Tax=Streptomyces achromogenes TaxID=67255 RepID=UPI002785A559|nr:caspase family protein [Streptomyces achromogenes]MDQ0834267.1 WD40 repeat protein [Streptomyces achromogenes]
MVSPLADPTGSAEGPTPHPDHLSIVAIEKYEHFSDLPRIVRCIGKVSAKLHSTGFNPRELATNGDTTSTVLLRALTRWPDVGRRLLLYWAGHGETRGDGRLYLICTDSLPKALAATAISGHALGELLAESPYEEVVVVVDSCHGGGGSQEIVGAYRGVVEQRRYPRGVRRGIAVISSAGRFQQAREGAFSSALLAVLDEGAVPSDRWLSWTDQDSHISPSDLAAAIREKLESDGSTQAPEFDMFGMVGRFFPNPRFRRRAIDETEIGAATDGTSAASLQEFLTFYEGASEEASRPWAFFGREAALSRISGWAAGSAGNLLLITGPPGSGKSALAREIVRRALRADTDPGLAPRVIGGVNLSGKSLVDVVGEFAQIFPPLEETTDEPDASAIVRSAQGRRNEGIVVIDALDEAYEPDLHDIIMTLVQPFARAGHQILVSSRMHSTGREVAFPPPTLAATIVDLLQPDVVVRLNEDPLQKVAITNFVTHRLLTAPGTSYSGDRARVHALASEVADVSRGNFLLARVLADTILGNPGTFAVASMALDTLLQADLHTAFEADLRRFGDREVAVHDLLRPLAWAYGRGLPSSEVWLPLANALAPGASYAEADLAWVVYHAGDYLQALSDGGQTVYRPFHEEFGAYLRARTRLTPQLAHEIITDTLVAIADADGRRSWSTANAYIREHLSTHAAAAERLPALAENSQFMVHSDQYKLAKVIGYVDLQQSPLARLWCKANDRMDNEGPERRAALMQAAALLDEPEALPLLNTALDLPWAGRWSLRATAPDGASHRGTPIVIGRVAGQELAMAAEGTAANIWELATGRLVRRLPGAESAVRAVAVGDIGGRPAAATATATDVLLWDLHTGHLLRRLVGSHGAIHAVAIADLHGTTLAVIAGDDDVIRVRDLDRGDTITTLPGPHGAVHALAVADLDGTMVAITAGDDGTVRISDVAAGTTIRMLSGHRGRVRTVTSTVLDGEPLVVTAGDDGTARLWSLRTGEPRQEFEHSPSRVASAAVLPAFGTLLVVTGTDDGQIRFFNGRTGRLAGRTWRGFIDRTATTGFVVCIAVIEHGRRRLIATGNDDGMVRLWDLDSGHFSGALSAHRGWVRSVATGVVGGRTVLASAGYDETCRLWDVETRSLVATLDGHRGWIYSVCIGRLRGRDVVVTAAEDTTIRIWDPQSGRELQRLEGHRGWIRQVALGAIDDRPVIVSASDDGTARVWNPLDGSVLLTVDGHENWIVSVALAEVSGRAVLATAGDDGVVRTWDAVTGVALATITDHTAWTSSVALGRIGGRWLLASGSDDCTAGLWDPLTGAKVHRFAQPDWCGFVTFATHQGRSCLLTAGDKFAVRVWDIDGGGLVDVIGEAPRGPQHVALANHSGSVYLAAADDYVTQVVELFVEPE